MYGYPYIPPPSDHELIERAMKLAIKLKERDANKKAKAKELEEKKAKEASQRTMSALEWFIIGIIMQPFVGTAYNVLLHKLQAMTP